MRYEMPEKLKRLENYKVSEGNYRIRLDANESFLSLPKELLEKAVDAVKGVSFNRYPDPFARGVCSLAGSIFGYPAENIVAGNGSDELISVIIGAFAQRGQRVLLSEPDFSMYRFYSDICELLSVPLKKNERRPDVDAMIREANNKNAAILIFSNPCNPSGMGVMKEDVLRLIKSVNCLVVIDEAYMDFWDQSIIGSLSDFDNAIVLRTCSKAFGLAAVRLGFALGSSDLIDGIRKAKSPYNVNSVTQAIGEAMLSEGQYLEESVKVIIKSRDSLQKSLKGLAQKYPQMIEFLPAVTNFSLIKSKKADALFEGLKSRGILVRKIMGDCLRITAGSPDENAEVLTALEALIKEV